MQTKPGFRAVLIVIVLILILNFCAAMFGWYGMWHWFDIPMHLAGGFAMGMFGLALFYDGIQDIRFGGRFERHFRFWFIYLFVVGFVSLIAVGWEIHEFVLDRLFDGLRQPSIADTMMDFLMGVTGGFLSVAVLHRRK